MPNLQIISLYLLQPLPPHILLNRTSAPSYLWKRETIVFFWQLSLTYRLSISLCDRYVDLQQLKVFNDFATGIGKFIVA